MNEVTVAVEDDPMVVEVRFLDDTQLDCRLY
jgi:hypothetical protein